MRELFRVLGWQIEHFTVTYGKQDPNPLLSRRYRRTRDAASDGALSDGWVHRRGRRDAGTGRSIVVGRLEDDTLARTPYAAWCRQGPE
jgi:hypothetical protein